MKSYIVDPSKFDFDNVIIDKKAIEKINPHRFELALLDGILLSEEEFAVGYYDIPEDAFWVRGHFPGKPIMPGVTIVEAMAQTAGVMVGATMGLINGDLLIYFMAIDKCKFRRKVVPGDVLEMAVSVTRGKPGGKVWKFSGVATVDGEMACETEFTAMMDLPQE